MGYDEDHLSESDLVEALTEKGSALCASFEKLEIYTDVIQETREIISKIGKREQVSMESVRNILGNLRQAYEAHLQIYQSVVQVKALHELYLKLHGVANAEDVKEEQQELLEAIVSDFFEKESKLTKSMANISRVQGYLENFLV